MATDIKIKKIGMSVAPITIVEWAAKEGDFVKEGDIVMVIETEKIRHDIEARGSGLLHIIVDANNNADIGSVVGVLVENEEELGKAQKAQPKGSVQAAPKAEEAAAAPAAEAAPQGARPKRGRTLISPLARKLAEEHMIDIAMVSGSGPEGRIIKEDIERAIAGETDPKAAPGAYSGREVQEIISLTGTRQAIAEHMHRSLQVSAQLTGMGEIDASQLMKLHKSLKKNAESTGMRVTFTDVIVAAVAKALRANPMINSSIIDNEIKVWKNVNVGVAVNVDDGLIVPVIKDADKKSLFQISTAMKGLIAKAKDRKLTGEDVTGGTFTISNIGALGFGWRFDTLIINQPESAILGIGGITDKPAVKDGQIVIQPTMTYSFTYDHRLVDGALSAGFMKKVIELLEDPFSLLMPSE